MGNAASVTVRHVALEKKAHRVKNFKLSNSQLQNFEKFSKNRSFTMPNYRKVSLSPRAKFEGRSRPRRRRRPLRKDLAVGERWLGGRLEAESTWLNLEHVVKIWNTW